MYNPKLIHCIATMKLNLMLLRIILIPYINSISNISFGVKKALG
ncbi:MAG: hypothetical protein A4E54_02845 [Pelotomaculum sp. PtaB.Bin117]|nr:MAG: hypothetical protein A4E54_02845 [Pelotomaculum sp. PtaB.Bin117]OPY59113.1 MAG: hypothetical protein A4E56_03298 [Pelotomaculum sp. PtaU1.Bin065]